MVITKQDIRSFEVLKSVTEGEILSASLYGGSTVILLRKHSGEISFLSSAPSELRASALAAKKFPNLGVPIIVKSLNEEKEKALTDNSGIKKMKDSVGSMKSTVKPQPQGGAKQNLKQAKTSLSSSKVKLDKILKKK